MNIAGKAIRYEALLRKRGMRPRALRSHVLELLSGSTDFVEVKVLEEKLAEKGIESDGENIRYVVKRLNEAGLLERKKVGNKNKYLFRLRSLEELENDFPSH